MEIASGCPQARPCKYCSLYTGEFIPARREQIEDDIDEVATRWLAKPKRVFLQTCDPFAISHELLMHTLSQINERIPSVQSVGGFCRVATVKAKSDAELADWARMGVDNIMLDVDSGDDETLANMNKQHRAVDIIEQCARLDAAGISYTLSFKAGIAGAGNGERNALCSAETFSQTHPAMIYCYTVSLSRRSELGRETLAGIYKPISERETMREIRDLFANLTCETVFDCLNEANVMLFFAEVPKDQAKIVEKMDRLIKGANEEYLQHMTQERVERNEMFYHMA